MSVRKKLAKRALARKFRVRNKIKECNESKRSRISVVISNRYMSLSLIDHVSGKTLLGLSSKHLGNNDAKVASCAKNLDTAKLLGQKFAQMCLAQGTSEILFDRGTRLYHGKVQAVAESMRESGLNF